MNFENLVRNFSCSLYIFDILFSLFDLLDFVHVSLILEGIFASFTSVILFSIILLAVHTSKRSSTLWTRLWLKEFCFEKKVIINKCLQPKCAAWLQFEILVSNFKLTDLIFSALCNRFCLVLKSLCENIFEIILLF